MEIQHHISLGYKACCKAFEKLRAPIYNPLNKLSFYLAGAQLQSGFKSAGLLSVKVTRRGALVIGKNFHCNSGRNHNIIGRQGRAIFWVEGDLNIGNNVGISNSALICRKAITIEDDVTIGGNCVIYDTDFHPVDPHSRLNETSDIAQAASAPVIIRRNAFIGAHSTILKGVEIGENAVIGACSLVSKSIPANEVWAGNPARKLKALAKNQER